MRKAPVNKIIPFSQVDGPGNRSAIFFQGCGYSCRFCHNPETIRMCVHCEVCVAVCPVGALRKADDRVVWDKELCCGCDACIGVCPNFSTPKITEMSVLDIMAEIRPSLPFIRGITTSGGECTLHSEFLTELSDKIHQSGKTVFIDTNGQTDLRQLPAFTDSFDMAMLDVKSAAAQEHQMLTGADMDMVFSNLEFLLSRNKLFEVRTVIIPELLDNERNVEAVSRIIGAYPQVRYKLIKFRTWGVKGELKNTPSPTDEYMERLGALARRSGVQDIVII